jgi:hypothetical protein
MSDNLRERVAKWFARDYHAGEEPCWMCYSRADSLIAECLPTSPSEEGLRAALPTSINRIVVDILANYFGIPNGGKK